MAILAKRGLAVTAPAPDGGRGWLARLGAQASPRPQYPLVLRRGGFPGGS